MKFCSMDRNAYFRASKLNYEIEVNEQQVEEITWNKTPTEGEEGKIYVAVHTDSGTPLKGNMTPKEILAKLNNTCLFDRLPSSTLSILV